MKCPPEKWGRERGENGERERGKKRRGNKPLLVIIKDVYIQLPRELSIVCKDKE